MSGDVQTRVGIPALQLETALGAVGDITRWNILRELARGEARMVVELADTLDKTPSAISKHMKVLRQSGLVAQGQAGLYRIPSHFLPEPGKRVMDLGFCLLRFDDASA